MKRKIIMIDEERCTGCGCCAKACHEGAIAMVEGKAKLISDSYCDGLGDCLPTCPAGAITFTEREAEPYDAAAVELKKHAQHKDSGCPGSRMHTFAIKEKEQDLSFPSIPSELTMWPVQIKLLPPHAPFFDGADLLVAATCSAFAYASFHKDFMHHKLTAIGCPKLDGVDYSEKLGQIIRENNIKSVRIVRMEVPCCGGLEMAVKSALAHSGKALPLSVTVISTDGTILA